MKTLFKLIMLALALAIVYPAAWLAWRMDQPMDAPEFKGLTYHQYTAWMREEQDKAWADVDMDAYRAQKPESELDAQRCYENDIIATHILPFVISPINMILETVLADAPFPEHPLQTLWKEFEGIQTVSLAGNVNRYPACRIPGAIPDDYAISVGAKLPALADAP